MPFAKKKQHLKTKITIYFITITYCNRIFEHHYKKDCKKACQSSKVRYHKSIEIVTVSGELKKD